ncbi:hypothetical protein F5B22DRAFT_320988 [Xylaria bambusicola]|uniref:uncharacterized protein n=1 Tax=Xylaria bambusicola TaxID=326684 RepID=UPI002007F4B5|nr:uncharacterized protein F5B22DRAFT_320988 [Xylaria bambusicola]KAI0509643.1 hypothetical protein F5B22DRAFT_320988 [Xylaria bambusicola]
MAGLSPTATENRASLTPYETSPSLSTVPSTATNATPLSTPSSTATASSQKPRSCVVCRSRKVRCNKESPCSNCKRAGIPCVFPSADRPPRWAKRLERFAHNAAAEERSARAVAPPTAQVMERLRNLENLVKDLTSQLEQAHALSNPSTGNSPASSANDRDGDHHAATHLTAGGSSVHSQLGRLVLNDAGRSRYMSSRFWSHVNDEIDGIKMETQHLAEADVNSSDDEDPSGASPSTHELERSPSERHAFIFGHNLGQSGPDLSELRPLPSQVPFLLDVFFENVNIIAPVVHQPTIKKMARSSRDINNTSISPANEALMFSMYYAAVTSMEDDDVVNNFGSTKAELNLRFRMGLEYTLAKADFLNKPDLVLVQAFTIFLFLVRRHESPRFVWMMTGLVIRMAQSLGLQRDGTHFKHLTALEVHIRRRVWYSLCSLDVRSSEDQGTDFTIQIGSFDTKLPLNINDDDIDINTREMPTAREGLTDMSNAIANMEISNISRQIVTPGIGLEEQSRLLNTIYTTVEERYLKFSPQSGDISHWVMLVVTRLVIAKLTLFSHLPVLFSSPRESLSNEIRNKLLIAAIEVAEFNHALNTEKACRQWRWVYQTYTHWHAIVYLLIDICRRPWSPISERSWSVLHSPWLIPARSTLDKDSRTWVPLRKLMLKARMHRHQELERLRHDLAAAEQLEIDDQTLPVPLTTGSVSASDVADIFRGKWRGLVGMSEMPKGIPQTEKQTPLPSSEPAHVPLNPLRQDQNDEMSGITRVQDTYPSTNDATMPEASMRYTAPGAMTFDQPLINGPQFNAFSRPAIDWSNGHPESAGLLGWFWADADPAADVFGDINMDPMDFNVDLDGAVDWHNWVESAKVMEMDAQDAQARANKPSR